MRVVRAGIKDPVTDLGPGEEKSGGWIKGGDASRRSLPVPQGL